MTPMKWHKLMCKTRQKNAIGKAKNEDHGTKTSKDPRSPFQRDYDRTLFSTPVRRLQDKAQVFPLEPNDSVRTRLTHSLEVSNLARSLASRISDWLVEEGKIYRRHALHIRSIAATCGLLHDLGNPPFGHAGEEAMRQWFRKELAKPAEEGVNSETLGKYLDEFSDDRKLSMDFREFDGNAQTIRLLTKLQMLADFDGLNLTLGTLSAALKYTARSDKLNDQLHEKEKPGFFFSEECLVQKIRNDTGTLGRRHPITFLVEACDDIVYSVVDLEDGIKKGAISWKKLDQLLREKDDSGTAEELLNKTVNNVRDRLNQSGLTERIEDSSQAFAEACAQLLRTNSIGSNLDAVEEEFKSSYESIMNGSYHNELVKTCSTSSYIGACKEIAKKYVFNAGDILQLESMGGRVISDLMDFFWNGVRRAPYRDKSDFKTFEWKAYQLASDNYRHVFESAVEDSSSCDLPAEYRRLQLVADYICGMTDGFARSLHRTLFNG